MLSLLIETHKIQPEMPVLTDIISWLKKYQVEIDLRSWNEQIPNPIEIRFPFKSKSSDQRVQNRYHSVCAEMHEFAAETVAHQLEPDEWDQKNRTDLLGHGAKFIFDQLQILSKEIDLSLSILSKVIMHSIFSSQLSDDQSLSQQKQKLQQKVATLFQSIEFDQTITFAELVVLWIAGSNQNREFIGYQSISNTIDYLGLDAVFSAGISNLAQKEVTINRLHVHAEKLAAVITSFIALINSLSFLQEPNFDMLIVAFIPLVLTILLIKKAGNSSKEWNLYFRHEIAHILHSITPGKLGVLRYSIPD